MMFDFSYSNFDISETEEWFRRKDWTVKQFKDILFESQEEVQKVGWGKPVFRKPRSTAFNR